MPKLKNILLLFLSVFIYTSLFSQAEYVDKIVLSSQLNIRATPSIKGELVGVLQNGEKVKFLKDQKIEDCTSINSLHGCWQKIYFNDKLAYVFSPFIGDEIMLYYENTAINYYPKVNYWYACIYDSIKQKDILVEVETFQSESKYYDEVGTKIIETKHTDKSLFLIATNSKRDIGDIGVYSKNQTISENCDDYCRPGDKEYMYFETNGNSIIKECYYLITTGTYSINERGSQLEKYEVFVADNEPPEPSFTKIQNVSKHMPNSEVYKLEFYGDIDGDSKPDFILSAASSSGGANMLFLSSLALDDELVGLANIFYIMTGC